MKNYFIIHGSFGNGSEHYLPWLKNKLKSMGEVVCPDFPVGVGKQSYESWAKVMDEYKNKINKDTVFIGRSIGPVFVIKYLMNNNLHIKKLISISGFNNISVDGGDYDKVNKTMFVKNLKDFKKHCDKIICVYSENDPYVKLKFLKDFANEIADEKINIKDGGHFNSESGYGEKFEELLKFL